MNFTYTERGASIEVTGADEPNCLVAGGSFPSQEAHIRDAIDRIPEQHLRYVPTIAIGDRPVSGGGFSAGLIRLNRRTFGAEHNRRYLFTLVHEIGHAVDRATHCVVRFQNTTAETGAEWLAFRAIEYRGRNRFPAASSVVDRGGQPVGGTPRFGEHFAEGYAHLRCSGRHMTPQQSLIIRRLAGL